MKRDAQTYLTGHKPQETFQELVARVNANSCFPTEQGTTPPKVRRAKARDPLLVRKASMLTPKQLELLLELADSKRALATCRGESYAVKRLPDGTWSVVGLDADSHEHFVVGDDCSCEDSKFRSRTCKHVKALEAVR